MNQKLQILPFRPTMLWILAVASIGLGGCGGRMFLPSIEEETQLLATTDLGESKQYAVVLRARWPGGDLPAYSLFRDALLTGLERSLEEKLGVSTQRVDHSSDGEWQQELERQMDDTGWVTASTYDQFFHDREYDGYLLVTVEEEVRWDTPGLYEERPLERLRSGQVRYYPMFHMSTYAQSEDGDYLLSGRASDDYYTCSLIGRERHIDSKPAPGYDSGGVIEIYRLIESEPGSGTGDADSFYIALDVKYDALDNCVRTIVDYFETMLAERGVQ